ncbi:Phage terminase, large subunit GpA [Amphritea atlantica]|uniref:Phage terminase, large subunit GpA n=1 Tax=Amphritea atlantica TaxID=355243 RepID=A0A1H9GFS0_9GAMM|nr:Phage terminase, large subunit GpA [Amphritea atlantica]
MARVAAKAAELLTLPKRKSTKEFLETEYVLPDFGEYDFYYTPYFIGVCAALDDPDVVEVDLMKAAQIGWTFFLLGFICKVISESEYDPCPIIALFAKTGDAKNFHDEKFLPTAQANSSVTDVMDVSTSRKSGARWDNRTYPGGFIKLVGSNSPGNVKSTSKVGVGVVEEPDDTADNVAGQGDAIGNIEERLKRFIGSMLIVGGTPAVKGLSKTEARLDQTDKRVLPVVCHNCGESHVLNWDNVHWDSVDEGTEVHPVYGRALPDSAVYRCPCCGWEWDDYQRQENIRNTCFNAFDAGDVNAGWVPTATFTGRAGFMGLSELYVCMPGTSLADVVKDYLSAKAEFEKGNENSLIKFTNQKLGQAYEYKGDNVSADELRAKAEDYPELVVQRGGVFLTAGVDVQRDRLAIKVKAWGRDLESWLVCYTEIYAKNDINDINDPVWGELDRILFGSYRHEIGAVVRIKSASLDTSDGVTQGATYHYVRSRRGRGLNLMAIKGATSADAPIVTLPRRMDINSQKTKADKFGLQVWRVGTQAAKDLISGHLKLSGSGPNRIHYYESVRADYYDQMTGEIKAPSRTQRGKMVWQQKSGTAIEAWDCEVYATHAAMVEKLHLKKHDWWDHQQASLMQVDLLGDNAPDDLVTVIDNRPDFDEVYEVEEAGDLVQESKPVTVNPFKSAAVQSKPSGSQDKKLSLAELGRMMNR